MHQERNVAIKTAKESPTVINITAYPPTNINSSSILDPGVYQVKRSSPSSRCLQLRQPSYPSSKLVSSLVLQLLPLQHNTLQGQAVPEELKE